MADPDPNWSRSKLLAEKRKAEDYIFARTRGMAGRQVGLTAAQKYVAAVEKILAEK